MAASPTESFRIRHQGEHHKVVEAYGELDLASAPWLEELLFVVGRPPVTRLELDLSAVSFVDAYAMGCIERAARRVAESGYELVLSGVRPSVRHAMDVVGFGQDIRILPRPPAGRRLVELIGGLGRSHGPLAEPA